MNKIGVHIPEILMPAEEVELKKWSVVACDQYTSQLDYWEKVCEYVGDSPSALKIIFPEVYLEREDKEDRIKKINENMKKYVEENILVPQEPGFIYVDRKTSHTESRKGLIMAVDLENYDYNSGSQTLIRATEGTVLDRLPPRIKIRENASIELPHVMLLIDDPERTVIEPVAEKAEKLQKLYDFDLMMGGGHIKGYKIDDKEIISDIIKALENLSDPEKFQKRYGVGEDKGVLLFAAGDGNHSLATAKAHYENLKKKLSEKEMESHPARYALVEVVNIHDDGLKFEPIHRVIFNVNPERLLEDMMDYLNFRGCRAEYRIYKGKTQIDTKCCCVSKGCHGFSFITEDSFGVVKVWNPRSPLEVGTLQEFLDEYMKKDSNIKIDYIHGAEVVKKLGSQKGNMGFFLPSIDKNSLFKSVIMDGVLPRKTFSMGEADEKRYYLECRKIVK